MRWSLLLVLASCDRVFLSEKSAAIDAQDIDAALVCPDGYEAVAALTSRYKLIDDFTDQAIHRARCRAEDPQHTHLAVLDTQRELEDVRTWIDGKPIGNDFIWVGALQLSTATQLRDGWRWISKATVDDALWRPGEPNDSDNNEDHNEDGAAVRKGDTFGLTDLPQSFLLRAVCECDGIPEP